MILVAYHGQGKRYPAHAEESEAMMKYKLLTKKVRELFPEISKKISSNKIDDWTGFRYACYDYFYFLNRIYIRENGSIFREGAGSVKGKWKAKRIGTEIKVELKLPNPDTLVALDMLNDFAHEHGYEVLPPPEKKGIPNYVGLRIRVYESFENKGV